MISLLPAVLIGGPPNSGKSVLFYSLTKALHERGISHHVVRACPDGDGNWFHEIHREIGPDKIRLIYYPNKQWTDSFVNGICSDLERRHLPLLVDVGGQPQASQLCIFLHCTHSILLLPSDDGETAQFWHHTIASSGLSPLAEIHSELHGESVLTSASPIIRGTITGLERGHLAQGPVFEALVDCIAKLFKSYSLDELDQTKLALAPVQPPINIETLYRKFDPSAREWKREMLRPLLQEIPSHTPLAIYGKGPNWLYGTLAAHTGQQPFYQFDPRIGWLSPPTLAISTQSSPNEIECHQKEHESGDAIILNVRLVNEYLDYLQADHLPFPSIANDHGLILSGKLPLWLYTALVRLYQYAGIPWIACYQPQLNGAVVVMSHEGAHDVGDLIPMSVS
jgi:CRISPR-associated protein Csx3